MREYKFYIISNDGHIHGRPTVFVFAGDQEAINQASAAAISHDIEVWQDARLVAYVVSDEAKQMPPPHVPNADQHK